MIKSTGSTPVTALAIARRESNQQQWLEGKYFELRSRRRLLQDLVGDGGTLWVVVSRGGPTGRRYSLTFRFRDCRSHTYRRSGAFGRYAVRGDPARSEFFAENDARLLLLALRFQSGAPIESIQKIGAALQTPRRLAASDVALVERYAPVAGAWGAFLSYSRKDLPEARMLNAALGKAGLSVFQDTVSIGAGQKWKEAIARGIAGSQVLVVLVSHNTTGSAWVEWEVELANQHRLPIIPVFLNQARWTFAEVEAFQGVPFEGNWRSVATDVAQAVPTRLVATDSIVA